MENIPDILVVIMAGMAAVTIIDLVSAVTLGRLKFNYVFVPLSFLVLTGAGFWSFKTTGSLAWALVAPLVIGMYDSLVAFPLTKHLNPALIRARSSQVSLPLTLRILLWATWFSLFGFIGYLLAGGHASVLSVICVVIVVCLVIFFVGRRLHQPGPGDATSRIRQKLEHRMTVHNALADDDPDFDQDDSN
jgi:hypothetical protein